MQGQGDPYYGDNKVDKILAGRNRAAGRGVADISNNIQYL
ncbi:hypothetical protein LTSEALA_1783 [Salmonella enterica subsp. enterica serovar Alachua str. R6-377]|uniref:Uncharacterized protein n=1 Tax=Salmonella enterica subsp. enterica serovar Alachua str. R6-377 TaxID=913241 RepID=G5LMK3_SALET|nr:hypothetical protein LTSEALA_1783 [Salmonella enterica subsp. enterica serovar Alachua str. R6-377]